MKKEFALKGLPPAFDGTMAFPLTYLLIEYFFAEKHKHYFGR